MHLRDERARVQGEEVKKLPRSTWRDFAVVVAIAGTTGLCIEWLHTPWRGIVWGTAIGVTFVYGQWSAWQKWTAIEEAATVKARTRLRSVN